MINQNFQDASATKRLLIVEDNPAFLTQVSKATGGLPDVWEIVSFVSGREALDFIDTTGQIFDLALIDLGLPDISGIEVIRACRQKFSETPIVVISVIALEKTVLSAIEAGAHGYLLKDDSIDQITSGINQVMEGIYPLSPSLARFLFRRLSISGTNNLPSSDFKLTPREYETLKYLAEGNSYEEVASLMRVAVSTIQWNVRQIYRKLNVHSQVQAINKARNFNLI